MNKWLRIAAGGICVLYGVMWGLSRVGVMPAPSIEVVNRTSLLAVMVIFGHFAINNHPKGAE